MSQKLFPQEAQQLTLPVLGCFIISLSIPQTCYGSYLQKRDMKFFTRISGLENVEWALK